MNRDCFYKLDYEKKTSLMVITMSDSVDNEESYIESLSSILTKIKVLQPRSALIDIRSMPFRMTENLSAWVKKYIVTELLEEKITKVGYLTSKEKVQLRNFGNGKLRVTVSEKEDELLNWLKEA